MPTDPQPPAPLTARERANEMLQRLYRDGMLPTASPQEVLDFGLAMEAAITAAVAAERVGRCACRFDADDRLVLECKEHEAIRLAARREGTEAAAKVADHAALLDQRDEYAEALQKIAQWCNAYPVEVFPQEGADRALEQMKAAGIDPSCLHASWARHITEGMRKLIPDALRRAGMGGKETGTR